MSALSTEIMWFGMMSDVISNQNLDICVRMAPFFGDLVFQDMVESGNAVRCNHDNAVTCVIDFAYFTGFKRGVFFHLVWPP